MFGFVEIINNRGEWPSTFYLLEDYGRLYIRDKDCLLRKKISKYTPKSGSVLVSWEDRHSEEHLTMSV